jgi:hypothetical protein
LIVLSLAACSSVPSVVEDKTQMQKIPEFKNDIPEWYKTENVRNDDELIVAATAYSKDMNIAVDKATMNARIELANRLSVRVESLVRESTIEDAGKKKSAETSYDRVTKLVTKQVLSMYNRDKLYLAKENDGYRAFVLLKMPVDEARKIVTGAVHNTREDRLNDLEKEIKKAN